MHHLRRDAVLGHEAGILVTGRAQRRRLEPERRRCRIDNVMHAVAADAGWHIDVIFVEERRAMHAAAVLIEDGAVTLRARLRNPDAGGGQRLPGGGIDEAAHGVRGVAIGADGCVAIAGRLRPAVNAIVGLGRLIGCLLYTSPSPRD